MYCSACGTQLLSDLNFCSRCWAATERNHSASASVRPFAIGATVIGFVGLGAFIPFFRMLLNSSLDPTAMAVFAFGYLVTLLIMFGSMMSMARKLAGARSHRETRRSRNRQEEPPPAPVSFREVNTSQLYPGDPGIGSVTDSTTRTLDQQVRVERH